VSKLSPELSELVVYTRSVPFRSFELAAKGSATDMSSFSESDALRHVKDSGTTSAPPGHLALVSSGKKAIIPGEMKMTQQ